MAPDAQEIRVALTALRGHASDWRKQEQPLKDCATSALSMQLTGLEMGIFFPLHGPYTALIEQLSDRCTEGARQMVSISDTLTAVARVYADEETRHVHALQQLW